MRRPPAQRAKRSLPEKIWANIEAIFRVRNARWASVFIGVMLICAIFAPWISPEDPYAQDILHRFAGPSAGHWLGTDYLGRDLLSRLIYGCRVAVLVSFGSVMLSAAVGTVLGVIAGYHEGGKLDYAILLLFDVVRAFPQVILALAIVAALGPSLLNLILALAITCFPFFGRIARAQTLLMKEADFVKAAEALGLGTRRIIFKHIIPNILAPIIVCVGMDMATMIVYEAGLSFLGLGVRPPNASWGIMLRNGYKYIQTTPWMILWPALAIAGAMIAFSMFSEGMRIALDPKERDRNA